MDKNYYLVGKTIIMNHFSTRYA